MSRSSKKQPYVFSRLLKTVAKMNETNTKKPIKTWSRASVIYPEFVGFTFAVYNGKKTCSSLLYSRNGRTQTW